ncbi:MAG: hypothetical protein IJ097_02770 [Bacilli bacterium]|nr:hypothetical protein [Bacilli bacterium]
MKVKLGDYIKELERRIRKNDVDSKLESEVKDMIDFYQHERLIKLLVILFAAVGLVAFLISAICFESLKLFTIFGIVFILFLPGILEFYYLENKFCKLYNLYFKLKKKMTDK